MRIRICAVGRLRAGPEKQLIDDYTSRFNRTGRALGLGPLEIIEVDDRKSSGMAAEAELLEKAIPNGALIAVMDERGVNEPSPDFALRLSKWNDQGQRDLAILIGGADGIDKALRARANHAISLGKMVWPHMLARVMLTEQLYRAASILSNGPYHRA